MRAAASAYGTIIWGISDAKTGSNNGPGRARENAGTRTGRTSIETRRLVQSERGLIDHRPGTEKSPVQSRAAQSLEVDPVRPIRGFHLGQVDAAPAGRVKVEERCARQKPANGLRFLRGRVHRADEAVDQADERFAVGDVAGTIDQRVRPSDQIERHERVEIACMHRDRLTDVGRKLGRRPYEHRDLEAGGDRLAKHLATEGPCGAEDEEARHHNPPR